MKKRDKILHGPAVWSRYGIWISAMAIIIVLPLFFRSDFSRSMLSQIGIAIIFALSYNMLLGEAGLLSFGHAVFYGLGGFFTIHILNAASDGMFKVPLELMPLAGGLGAVIVGLVFGWLSTERAGTPFALISLGIGELIAASSLMFPSFFGGEEGISCDRMAVVTFTGIEFGKQITVYYLIAFWSFLCTILMYLLTRTPLGRLANAVRDNPERASFVGYSPHWVRTLQYTLAAFFAGIAGGLYAVNYEIVTAEMVGFIPSGNVLMMTYIGGVGHFFGPILGAILITFMQLSLANITHAWLIYFGLLFVGMVIWAPTGLAGIIMLHEPVWKAKLMKRLIPSYAMAVFPAFILFLGSVMLIEISYHLSLSVDPTCPMKFFHIQFKAQSPTPWVIAPGLILIGFWLFRRAMKRIHRSWQGVTMTMKKGSS